jgi:hypothetical protein
VSQETQQMQQDETAVTHYDDFCMAAMHPAEATDTMTAAVLVWAGVFSQRLTPGDPGNTADAAGRSCSTVDRGWLVCFKLRSYTAAVLPSYA